MEEENWLPSPAPSDVGKPDAIENRPPSDLPADPYMLRSAVKSNSELEELRKRGKNWKGVGEYHEKQNLVGFERQSTIYISGSLLPERLYIPSSLTIC